MAAVLYALMTAILNCSMSQYLEVLITDILNRYEDLTNNVSYLSEWK